MFTQRKNPSYTKKGPGRFHKASAAITAARIKAKQERKAARAKA